MKKVILALMFFVALSLCDASAQGLKGAPDSAGCHRDYEMPKIKGTNDPERWRNLARVGPSLIGMTKLNVEGALGPGHFDSEHSRLQYAVTGRNPTGKGYAYTNLMLDFKNGKVAKFVVSSVDWQ